MTAEYIEDVFSVVVVLLILLGLGGGLYTLFRPDGWLSYGLEALWSISPVLVWLSGLGVASLFALGKRGVSRLIGSGLRSDLPVYLLISLGLFFFFKLIVTGTL